MCAFKCDTPVCLSFYLILIDQCNKEITHDSFIIDNETRDLKVPVSYSYNEEWQNAFGSWIIGKGESQTWKLKRTNKNPDWTSSRPFLYGIIRYTENDKKKYKKNKIVFC